MSIIDVLLDLQATDSTLDQLSKRLADIKAVLHETDELVAARQARVQAEHLAGQQRTVRKDLELQAATLDDKIQQAEKRLYSGLVKNPKELLDLQNDIQALRRQKAATDDKLFEAMLALDQAETALAQAAAALTRIEADWLSSQSGLRTELQHLELDITTQTTDQHALRAQLPAAELTLYDQLRRRKGGIAVAELNGTTCHGCGVRVTSDIVRALSHADHYARCGNCERILVRA